MRSTPAGRVTASNRSPKAAEEQRKLQQSDLKNTKKFVDSSLERDEATLVDLEGELKDQKSGLSEIERKRVLELRARLNSFTATFRVPPLPVFEIPEAGRQVHTQLKGSAAVGMDAHKIADRSMVVDSPRLC